MNIYFDYDSHPTTYNIVDKHLSRILTRIKTEVIQLTYTVTRNNDRPMPDGYILIKISGLNGTAKVFGFDEQFRKELSDILKLLNLTQIIQSGSHA